MVMMRDLESCAGNDNLISESDIRRSAHTLPVLLAGADFIFSGFGSIPRYDNAFALSNFNSDDMDDFLVLQRDWGADGGLRTVSAEHLEAVRRRGGQGRPGGVPRPRTGRLRRRPGRGSGGGQRIPRPACRPSEDGGGGGGLDRGQAADGVRRHRVAAPHRVHRGGRGDRDVSPANGCAGTSCRPRRSSTSSSGCCPSSPIPTTTPGPATGYALTEQRRAEIDGDPAGPQQRGADRRPGASTAVTSPSPTSSRPGRAATRARCASGCRRPGVAACGSRCAG